MQLSKAFQQPARRDDPQGERQGDLAAWGIEHKRSVLDRVDMELNWRRFGKTLRQVFEGLQGRSPFLSAGDAVYGAAAAARVKAERSDGGGCQFVSNALPGYFPLELGEGEQYVQGEAPHGSGGVELLGDGNEGNLPIIEDLHDPGEVGQGAGGGGGFWGVLAPL